MNVYLVDKWISEWKQAKQKYVEYEFMNELMHRLI